MVSHHSQVLNASNGPGLLYNDPRSKESLANTETNNALVLNTFQSHFPTSVLNVVGVWKDDIATGFRKYLLER